jgi:hypothetical protein
MTELERVIDANLALAREVREQSDQWQTEDHQRRVSTRSERGKDRDRR